MKMSRVCSEGEGDERIPGGEGRGHECRKSALSWVWSDGEGEGEDTLSQRG
jgi:hypothetical protein